MIVVGGLLAVWGALVLWFARPLPADRVLRSVRPGTAPEATPAAAAGERVARWVRRAGLAGLVAGLVLSALGAIRIAVESM